MDETQVSEVEGMRRRQRAVIAQRRDRRPLYRYLFGLALVIVGAGLMEWLDSWVPLALAGSASLMLTVPLVRQIAARRR